MADKPDDQPEKQDVPQQNPDSAVATQVRETPAADFRAAQSADFKAKQDSIQNPEALKLLGLPPEFKKFLDDMQKDQKKGGAGKEDAGKDGPSGKDGAGKDAQGKNQNDRGDETAPGQAGHEQKDRSGKNDSPGNKDGAGQTQDASQEKKDKPEDARDSSGKFDSQNQKSNDKFDQVVNAAQNGNKAAIGMLVGLATGAGDPKFKDDAKKELKDMVKAGGETADDVRQAAKQMAERGFRPNDLSERREANNLLKDLKVAANSGDKVEAEKKPGSADEPKDKEKTVQTPDGGKITTTYRADGTEKSSTAFDKEGHKTKETNFDKMGEKSSERFFNKDGTSMENKYRAFSRGQIESTTNFRADGSAESKETFGKDDKPTTKTTFQADGKTADTVTQFKDGKPISETKIGSDGKPQSTKELGDDGKTVKSETAFQDGKAVSKTNFENGKKTSETQLNPETGKPVSQTSFDKDGFKTRETTFDSEGRKQTDVNHQYDGGKSVVQYRPDGTEKSLTSIDKDGHKTSEKTFDKNGDKESTSYFRNDGTMERQDKFRPNGGGLESTKNFSAVGKTPETARVSGNNEVPDMRSITKNPFEQPGQGTIVEPVFKTSENGKPGEGTTKDVSNKNEKESKPQIDFFPLAAGLAPGATPESQKAAAPTLREKAMAQSATDSFFKPGDKGAAQEQLKNLADKPGTKDLLKEKGVDVKADGSTIAERTTEKGKETVARDKAGKETFRLEENKDGSRTFHKQGGQEWTSKDGQNWTSKDGGTWRGTVEIKNGAAVETSKSGSEKYITEPNGTKTHESTNPDKSTVTEKTSPDGTREVVARTAEGKEAYTFKSNPDGSKEAHVGGFSEHWKSSDGKNWNAFDKDGKQLLDGDGKPRTWQGEIDVKNGNLVNTSKDGFEHLNRPDGQRVDTGASQKDLAKLNDTLTQQQPALDKEIARLKQKVDEDARYNRPSYEQNAKELKQVQEAKDKVDKVVKALKDSHPGDSAAQDVDAAKRTHDLYKNVKELNSFLKEMKNTPNKALETLTKKLMPGTGLPDAKDLVIDTMVKSWDRALQVNEAFKDAKREDVDAKVDKFAETYKGNSPDRVKQMSEQLEKARKESDNEGEFKAFLDKVNTKTDGKINYKGSEDSKEGLTAYESTYAGLKHTDLFNSKSFDKKQSQRHDVSAPSSSGSSSSGGSGESGSKEEEDWRSKLPNGGRWNK